MNELLSVLILVHAFAPTPGLDDRAEAVPSIEFGHAAGQPACDCSWYAYGWYWAKWNRYRDPDTCGSAVEAYDDEFVDGCRSYALGLPLEEGE